MKEEKPTLETNSDVTVVTWIFDKLREISGTLTTGTIQLGDSLRSIGYRLDDIEKHLDNLDRKCREISVIEEFTEFRKKQESKVRDITEEVQYVLSRLKGIEEDLDDLSEPDERFEAEGER